MVAINTILIIVNGGPLNAFELKRIIPTPGISGNFFGKKGGELAVCLPNVPLTTSVVGWRKPAPDRPVPGSLS
jgi:hypothetical protein